MVLFDIYDSYESINDGLLYIKFNCRSKNHSNGRLKVGINITRT